MSTDNDRCPYCDRDDCPTRVPIQRRGGMMWRVALNDCHRARTDWRARALAAESAVGGAINSLEAAGAHGSSLEERIGSLAAGLVAATAALEQSDRENEAWESTVKTRDSENEALKSRVAAAEAARAQVLDGKSLDAIREHQRERHNYFGTQEEMITAMCDGPHGRVSCAGRCRPCQIINKRLAPALATATTPMESTTLKLARSICSGLVVGDTLPDDYVFDWTVKLTAAEVRALQDEIKESK